MTKVDNLQQNLKEIIESRTFNPDNSEKNLDRSPIKTKTESNKHKSSNKN